jgi:hypothetical protein
MPKQIQQKIAIKVTGKAVVPGYNRFALRSITTTFPGVEKVRRKNAKIKDQYLMKEKTKTEKD